MKMDAVDLELINQLQTDCKQSIRSLAEKVNLSITPTHERIKRLEASGVITGYRAIVDHKVLGKTLTAYCNVKLTKHSKSYISEFETFISTLNEVVEVIYLTGSSDYLLKVVLKDMQDFQNFVLEKLSSLEIISEIESSFVINQVKKIVRV